MGRPDAIHWSVGCPGSDPGGRLSTRCLQPLFHQRAVEENKARNQQPHKWGIMIYALCESRSDYMWNFEVYSGTPGLSNSPMSVVLRLSDALRGSGYIVYTDNYYTCPDLSEQLHDAGTMSVSVVRSNRRGHPATLMKEKLKKAQVIFKRKGEMLVVRWRDKWDVAILSTIYGPETVQVQWRAQVKQKPAAVADYTKHMAGVDKSDQLQAQLPFQRKTIKWWKKLFFHLVTVAAVNASIIHNKHQEDVSGGTWRSFSRFWLRTGLTLLVPRKTRRTRLIRQLLMPQRQPDSVDDTCPWNSSYRQPRRQGHRWSVSFARQEPSPGSWSISTEQEAVGNHLLVQRLWQGPVSCSLFSGIPHQT